MSTQSEPPVGAPVPPTAEDRKPETAWAGLVTIGAIAIVLSIVALELIVIQEIVPPLIIVAVLLVAGIVLMRAKGRPGVIMLGIVGLLYFVLLAPFVGESFAFPASTVDFVINLVSILSSLVIVVSAIALLRAGATDTRSAGARRFGATVLAIVVVGTMFSIAARLTREDPLGQEGDLDITAKDTEFIPTRLEVQGPAVSFFIENEDLTAHTFTIDELDVDEGIPGGGSARVELASAEEGEYEYYCSVTGHEDMKGTVTIGDAN